MVFLGFEKKGRVGPGLIMGSEPNTLFLKDMIEIYSDLHFINSDGSLNLTTIVDHTTIYLKSKGLSNEDTKQIVNDVVVYPTDYFAQLI